MEFALLNLLADYLSNCNETDQKELINVFHKLESFYLKNGYYQNHRKDYLGCIYKLFCKIANLLQEKGLVDIEAFYNSQEFKDSVELIKAFSES